MGTKQISAILFLLCSGCSLDGQDLTFRNAEPPPADVASSPDRGVDRSARADASAPDAMAVESSEDAGASEVSFAEPDARAPATDADDPSAEGCVLGTATVNEGEFCLVANLDPAIDRKTFPGACRLGRCCLGCWDADALRCRTGTQAPLCGTEGTTCRESKCGVLP